MDQFTSLPNARVNPKELTLPDWLRLWWGFAWRGLLIMAVSFLAGGALGFLTGVVIGLVLVMCGLDIAPFKLPMQLFGGCLGIVIGIGFFTVWFKWILRSRFGGLRLVLVRTHQDGSQQTVPDGTAVQEPA